jgi:hypothetical protein
VSFPLVILSSILMCWQTRSYPQQCPLTCIATRVDSGSGMSFLRSIVHGTNLMPCLKITQAVSSDISRTICWSYGFVTPPAMVGYAVVAMPITKLWIFRILFGVQYQLLRRRMTVMESSHIPGVPAYLDQLF